MRPPSLVLSSSASIEARKVGSSSTSASRMVASSTPTASVMIVDTKPARKSGREGQRGSVWGQEGGGSLKRVRLESQSHRARALGQARRRQAVLQRPAAPVARPGPEQNWSGTARHSEPQLQHRPPSCSRGAPGRSIPVLSAHLRRQACPCSYSKGRPAPMGCRREPRLSLPPGEVKKARFEADIVVGERLSKIFEL